MADDAKMVVITPGSTGFQVTVDKAVHYVGDRAQLHALIDKVFMAPGRGRTTRYEIRPEERAAVIDRAVIEGEQGNGTFVVSNT